MKAPPATTFIVSKTEFLFEVLIIALDAPAQLGEGRTRTAAKREASELLLPSRQITRRKAFFGSPIANCLAEIGLCSLLRRISEVRRPRPLQGLGGSGSQPGGHKLVEDWMPTLARTTCGNGAKEKPRGEPRGEVQGGFTSGRRRSPKTPLPADWRREL